MRVLLDKGVLGGRQFGKRIFGGLLSRFLGSQICPWSSRIFPVCLDAILFLGLLGIFYPGWGRVMAWLACGFALLNYSSLYINRALVRNALILALLLVFVSLLSANRMSSIRAVEDVALGLCMFLPGVFFGRRLLVRPFQAFPLIIACLFVLIQRAFPITYLGRLSYGFFDNPNLNGRGLTYLALLLGVFMWSYLRPPFGRRLSGPQRVMGVFLLPLAFGGAAELLILSNYRAGWLAISAFLLLAYIMVSRAVPHRKIAVSALLLGALLVLVCLFDAKGFGYGSVGERLLMWGCSLKSWLQSYFWFGSGFDSFKDLRLPCLPDSAIGVHAYPHNVLIELLLSSGIVGFACVLGFIIVQFQVLSRSGCLKNPVAVSALCALLGVLIMAQLGMKFASFTFVGSISALVGIVYSQGGPGDNQGISQVY